MRLCWSSYPCCLRDGVPIPSCSDGTKALLDTVDGDEECLIVVGHIAVHQQVGDGGFTTIGRTNDQDPFIICVADYIKKIVLILL